MEPCMKKRSLFERIGDVMLGHGFYIVLALCVAAIGLSGYYFFSSLSVLGDSTLASTATQVVVTPEKPSVSAQPTVSASPTPSDTASATPSSETEAVSDGLVSPSPSTSPSEEVSPEPSASAVVASPVAVANVFTWPVKGAVLSDYSLEVLAYDETMGDWRTHSGIDIAASLGTEVLATTAGTVVAVEYDLLMGTTVTIDHGDGLKSYYANLASLPTVSVGDTVKTGAVIGSVGSTAVAEAALAPHLHFELEEDGIAVDPISYLPSTSP